MRPVTAGLDVDGLKICSTCLFIVRWLGLQCSLEISEPKYTQKRRIRKTHKCVKKKMRMRIKTYAKRLISIYELYFCPSFVALSLFSLNCLRCGECENNLLVRWSVRN